MTEPITGICIVDKKGNCPPHYTLVDKTAEGEDADLWKDGIFRSKVTRYICYTKNITAGQWNHIVTNIVLIGLRDPVPQGYTAIRDTTDTKENALRKHILCVKMLPKTATESGIADIKLMRSEKYKAQQMTLVGEVNGIFLAYKLERVRKAVSSRPAPPPPVETQELTPVGAPPPQIPPRPNGSVNSPASVKHEPLAAISGISFKLHDRLTKSNSSSVSQDGLNITLKTRSELDEIFSYDFSRERGLTSR